MNKNMWRVSQLLIPEKLDVRNNIKPTVIILLAVIIPALQKTFGSMDFARKTFPQSGDFFPVMYMFLTAFILFGIIPFIVMRFFFQGTWREYGLHPGEWRAGLPVVLALFVLISALLVFPGSQTTEIQKYFPYDKTAGDSIFNFLRLQLFRGLFFYSAWEFFFRGFLLFSLRKYVGDWLAVLIQVIPSCLWHLGLPAGEIFSSIVAGILFGCLALRTRSVIWPFLLHYMVGIILDVFIIMTT